MHNNASNVMNMSGGASLRHAGKRATQAEVRAGCSTLGCCPGWGGCRCLPGATPPTAWPRLNPDFGVHVRRMWRKTGSELRSRTSPTPRSAGYGARVFERDAIERSWGRHDRCALHSSSMCDSMERRMARRRARSSTLPSSRTRCTAWARHRCGPGAAHWPGFCLWGPCQGSRVACSEPQTCTSGRRGEGVSPRCARCASPPSARWT